MGRPHVDALLVRCLNPAIGDAPARKHQAMFAFRIDHGEFQIAVERS
jgi:hypothetical protein